MKVGLQITAACTISTARCLYTLRGVRVPRIHGVPSLPYIRDGENLRCWGSVLFGFYIPQETQLSLTNLLDG